MVEFATRNGVPQCTLENFERDFADRHLLHGIVARWAREQPDAIALINADTSEQVSWARLERTCSALALKLYQMGLRKGDFLATSLPLLTEHIFLEYACFMLGVIHVPLDLRLKGPEVLRCLLEVKPKAFCFLGRTPLADFRPLGQAVKANCPFVEHLIQFSAPDETLEGAISAPVLAAQAQALAMEAASGKAHQDLLADFKKAVAEVGEHDGAQVIFTTGSTGYPKAALLSHRSITCQNMCLGAGFGFTHDSRMLVNLPPSHVGCQAEQLMTVFFWGGTAVILHIFDPVKSLQAIQNHRITALGQIPALFNLEWRLPDYHAYDLTSLHFALYGGQQVSRQFLEQLSTMARKFGTGLGLTEASGFCTYSPLDGTVEDILSSIGYDMPVYPMSIRAAMKEDGTAGEALPDGEVGHICFTGPQTFLHYVNNAEATRQALSSDGYLYTGDMGFVDAKGLHFSARAKLIIKPKGYQVFPAQVEEHFCALTDCVAACAVVGAEHDIYIEGIVAFVERKSGATLTQSMLEAHAREIAAYMRPGHYVILESGQMPLNRVAKTDYVTLKQRARDEIEALRRQGGWDRQ